MDYLFNLLNLGSFQTNKVHKVNVNAAFIMPINLNGDINISDSSCNSDLDLLLFRPHKKAEKNNNDNNKE
jgi:hypothetical protein